MCELLATAMHQEGTDKFFTVGLFSVLDAFLDKPMPMVLQLLLLSPELNDALLNRRGVLGDTLQCVVAYEQGNWDRVSCPNLASETIKAAYLEAISWSDEVVSQLTAAG